MSKRTRWTNASIHTVIITDLASLGVAASVSTWTTTFPVLQVERACFSYSTQQYYNLERMNLINNYRDKIKAPTCTVSFSCTYHTVVQSSIAAVFHLHEHIDGSTPIWLNTSKTNCCCYSGTCPLNRHWWRSLCQLGRYSWGMQVQTGDPYTVVPVGQRI